MSVIAKHVRISELGARSTDNEISRVHGRSLRPPLPIRLADFAVHSANTKIQKDAKMCPIRKRSPVRVTPMTIYPNQPRDTHDFMPDGLIPAPPARSSDRKRSAGEATRKTAGHDTDVYG